jgi:hypothetical protein
MMTPKEVARVARAMIRKANQTKYHEMSIYLMFICNQLI